MEFFLDTGDLGEIQKYYEMGVISGVTTNPLLIAKHKLDRMDFMKNVMMMDFKSVSIEMNAETSVEMLKEAEQFLKLGDAITIKLPMTAEGLKACKKLASDDVKVNMTLCFSLYQALLAAEAGAFFISPLLGARKIMELMVKNYLKKL